MGEVITPHVPEWDFPAPAFRTAEIAIRPQAVEIALLEQGEAVETVGLDNTPDGWKTAHALIRAWCRERPA